MTAQGDLLKFLSMGEEVKAHKPWPRFRLSRAGWEALVAQLAHVDWTLLGLWAEPQEVHAAFYDDAARTIAVASLACPEKIFPSLSHVRPGVVRLERMIQEMYGFTVEGLTDQRAWLDHGQFPIRFPLAAQAAKATPRPATTYEFLPVDGDGLHQIPVGPVHAGVIEPGHFRFTCNGETVVRLEERLGYVHKGIEKLLQGKTVAEAARIAGRISGDSTVAHALAFARAVEAAAGITVSKRAHALRAIMAEMERVANHLGDIGAICNDAAFAYMLAQCGLLRERVLQAALRCFGHRLMMDCVVPGGVSIDLSGEGETTLLNLVPMLRKEFAPLVDLYEDKATLLDRTVGTGKVSAALVHRFGAGGHVGRASARSFDARQVQPYEPYDALDFDSAVFSAGDVDARVRVRIHEIGTSLTMIEDLVRTLPEGALHTALPAQAGEGMSLVESFRGDILTWVRLDEQGRVARCHPRDPSWFQWPLLEASIEGNIVADFPLCNKSFNCSYSGQDL